MIAGNGSHRPKNKSTNQELILNNTLAKGVHALVLPFQRGLTLPAKIPACTSNSPNSGLHTTSHLPSSPFPKGTHPASPNPSNYLELPIWAYIPFRTFRAVPFQRGLTLQAQIPTCTSNSQFGLTYVLLRTFRTVPFRRGHTLQAQVPALPYFGMFALRQLVTNHQALPAYKLFAILLESSLSRDTLQ